MKKSKKEKDSQIKYSFVFQLVYLERERKRFKPKSEKFQIILKSMCVNYYAVSLFKVTRVSFSVIVYMRFLISLR